MNSSTPRKPIIPRNLQNWAFSDGMDSPMVFITGARQVGKSFMVSRVENASYFNWDTIEVKKAYLQDPYFFRTGQPWVIFDEIHKRRDWKKLLKGYCDSPSRKENFIVTGSGRLDQFQRGGDSLQGRYFSYQLWPLSSDEVARRASQKTPAKPRDWKAWVPDARVESDEALRVYGGFPAPFIRASERFLNRWLDEYITRLVREDVRDFSSTLHLDQMDLLARLLPKKVASPLSYLSLARDLETSPVGVKNWVRLFELLHLGFLIRPYHRKIHRAVKKEPKWYFQQWAYVTESGPRFENYLAVQLASMCSAWTEQGYGRYELCYLRDQDRREVDFVITKNLEPVALIEAKSTEQSWNSSLYYYSKKLGIPGFLVYPEGPSKRVEDLGWCVSSAAFLKNLWMG